MGATWLSGSFMNSFIYFGENRRILWSSLGPGIVAAIIGPSLIHGLTWPALAVSLMILTALVAARSFSLDHQVLLKRLGERQSALAEVERKLSIAVEASGDGLFEADMIAGTREISPGWAAMIGYGVAEIGDQGLDLFRSPGRPRRAGGRLRGALPGRDPAHQHRDADAVQGRKHQVGAVARPAGLAYV